MARPGRVVGMAVALLLTVGLASPAGAVASGTITECSGEAQLRADIAAGGSYTFTCSGTIILGSALLVSREVSLTAPASTVTIDGFNPEASLPAGSVRRVFTVADGGSLELTGIDVAHGLVSIAPVATPAEGFHQVPGCIAANFGWEGGLCGTPGVTSGELEFGASGTAASTPGLDGGNAPAGGTAEGGCMMIEAGGSATLVGDDFSSCAAEGSSQEWIPGTGPGPGTEGVPGYKQGLGGYGGEGGNGGEGRAGANTFHSAGHPAAEAGGNGADATGGGNGGNGTQGGSALGGAVFDAGALVARETRFTGDLALGGSGGAGGNGGRGGKGGNGGEGGTDVKAGTGGEEGESFVGGNAGNGSYGGDGGDGGNGGNGEGGAVYAQGYLTITASKFESDFAAGGAGGSAGLGGEGGEGGQGGVSGALHSGDDTVAVSGGAGGGAGDGGNAGDTGNGGSARGGAVLYATGSSGALPDPGTTFTGDLLAAGRVCDNLAVNEENCGTAAGPAGRIGEGGTSTPCKNPGAETECGQAGNGGSGGAGSKGVVGIAGTTEGQDVLGVPGSGSPPSGGKGASTGGSSTPTGSGTGAPVTKPPTAHAAGAGASAGKVTVTVSCSGAAGQSCAVSAAVTVEETLKGSKVLAVTARPATHHRTLTLGKLTTTVAAGTTRKLTVSLSAAGARLLRARHSLRVRLTVSLTAAGSVHSEVLERTALTLRASRPKH